MRELLELMQKELDTKNEMTDKVYENITNESNEGSKEANIIINFGNGNEKEIKKLVSKAIH